MKLQKDTFYWVKTGAFKWFNGIAYIYGEPPFLKIKLWYQGFDEKLIDNFDPLDIKEWGKSFKRPEEGK